MSIGRKVVGEGSAHDATSAATEHFSRTFRSLLEMSQRRLALLASGVVALHTSVTVLEEFIFSTPGFKEHVGGSALTLSMYLCSFLLYLPQSEASGQEGRTGGEKASGAASARSLLAVSTVYVGTSTLTKVSLRYLDVPTQTILKSGKLIPVMLGSLVIMRKRYSLREWVAALMLVSGIAVFNLSSNHPPALQSLLGCICVLCSLVCDALLGNFQQASLTPMFRPFVTPHSSHPIRHTPFVTSQLSHLSLAMFSHVSPPRIPNCASRRCCRQGAACGS